MIKSFLLEEIIMSKTKKSETKTKARSLWQDFKAFISKGSVLDMAVGVIIGGAFGAIVTAVVNILLSVCTWGVPGGLKGLVTVLPAINDAQKGIEGIGQKFGLADLKEMTEVYAESKGVEITSDNYAALESALTSKYTLHGTTYYFNGSSIIDWGSLINAVISFLIIAIVLFIIVKTAATLKQRKDEYEAKIREEYYKKHPEERPTPVEEAAPAPTETELLVQIRDLLKEKK